MVAIAEMLLEHGVNVNGQQSNGVTALMIAAEQVNLSASDFVVCFFTC